MNVVTPTQEIIDIATAKEAGETILYSRHEDPPVHPGRIMDGDVGFNFQNFRYWVQVKPEFKTYWMSGSCIFYTKENIPNGYTNVKKVVDASVLKYAIEALQNDSPSARALACDFLADLYED